MKALVQVLVAVSLPSLMLGEEPKLKAEIAPAAIAGPAGTFAIKVRLTNVSSGPVRVVRDPEVGDILGGPHFVVVIRESGGKEIGYAACGNIPDDLRNPPPLAPDEYVVALPPGHSTDVSIWRGWRIPEDGNYSVSFEYIMPEKADWPARYTFPSNVWRGAVRAKDVVMQLNGRASLNDSFTIPFSSVQKTCAALDRFNPGGRTSPGEPPLEEVIGDRLIELRDPASVPALERAVQRGVFGKVVLALGAVGAESSFPVLLAAYEKHQQSNASRGLVALVARSNKPLEPWMTAEDRVVRPPAEVIADWRDWWKSNKGDFKIVMTGKARSRAEVQRD